MVELLTVLVRTISDLHVFLLKKCEWLLQMQKPLTFFFFSKNISKYAIYNYQNFNATLINDIVSFEQLGPGRPRATFRCQDNYIRALILRNRRTARQTQKYIR